MEVYVYQTDNRPNLDYLQKTMLVNKHYCNILKYNYIFEKMDVCGDFHPALYKIMMVNNLLTKLDSGILVFLDSDAWIYNPTMLNKIINDLPEKLHGYFSRDPYIKKNTYINSGSFIIRINEYTKNMYRYFIEICQKDKSHIKNWPWDQYYISNYVFENKNKFCIFKPDIINTPIGKIIRHSWIKNFSSCKIMDNHHIFDIKNSYDIKYFPNLIENGCCYYSEKTIIQIGSHIGNTINDPLYNNVDETDKIIFIEPVPYLFEKLVQNYNEKFPQNNFIFINKAVSNFIGKIKLTIPSEKNDFTKLPFFASQLGSINPSHIQMHDARIITDELEVETTTINEIIKEYNILNIDLLHIDTEGHDYVILKNYDFCIKPTKIMFEHKHMDGVFQIGKKYNELIKLLNDKNYVVEFKDSEDTVMVLR